MKRKTLMQIGLILAAILFIAGVVASGGGKAAYFSVAALLFFLSLRLMLEEGGDSGRYDYNKLEKMVADAIGSHEKEKEKLEGFTDDPDSFAPVQEVVPLENFTLLVVFQNGVIKTYDIHKAMRKHNELKLLLAHQDLFKNVQVSLGGYRLDWTGRIALAADEIWLHGERYQRPSVVREKEREKEQQEMQEKAAKEAGNPDGASEAGFRDPEGDHFRQRPEGTEIPEEGGNPGSVGGGAKDVAGQPAAGAYQPGTGQPAAGAAQAEAGKLAAQKMPGSHGAPQVEEPSQAVETAQAEETRQPEDAAQEQQGARPHSTSEARNAAEAQSAAEANSMAEWQDAGTGRQAPESQQVPAGRQAPESQQVPAGQSSSESRPVSSAQLESDSQKEKEEEGPTIIPPYHGYE